MLYLNRDDPHYLMLNTAASFYSSEVLDDPKVGSRLLALQEIEVEVRAFKFQLEHGTIPVNQIADRAEVMWQRVTKLVDERNGRISPQLGGALAEPLPSVRATGVATNSPSPKPSKQKA